MKSSLSISAIFFFFVEVGISQSDDEIRLSSAFALAEEYLSMTEAIADPEERLRKVYRAYYHLFWMLQENGVAPGKEDREISRLIEDYATAFRGEGSKKNDDIMKTFFGYYLSPDARKDLVDLMKSENVNFEWIIELNTQAIQSTLDDNCSKN